MSHDRPIKDPLQDRHNTARFFVETRQLAWVLLAFTILWGVFGYLRMPQRKDPVIPVMQAVAVIPWPGADAEKVEQLVTRRVEEKMAENSTIKKIESISRNGLSVVYVELEESISNTAKEFDDIKLRLDAVNDLPRGAGPINFVRDFGDTAALMLTVASPKADPAEIALRANAIRETITRVRASQLRTGPGSPMSVVYCFPSSLGARQVRRGLETGASWMRSHGLARDTRFIEGEGYAGVDFLTDRDEASIRAAMLQYEAQNIRISEIHPDTWAPILVQDPAGTEGRLRQVAEDRYSYRDLDRFTDLMERSIKELRPVSKVSRSGLLSERILLTYSQERLAAYGLRTNQLSNVLGARNILIPGGQIQTADKVVPINPSGEYRSEKEIGDTAVGASGSGAPVYLRDLVDITREYDTPPRFLNYYTHRDASGNWQRNRAVTLAIQMKQGEQIGAFAQAVDAKLAELRRQLPPDLIWARTSDQPKQVEENVDLFMMSLLEAIVLVVIVSFIGFWEWRSALIMAVSIPITLAMTFGMMYAVGIDIQQVSVASLIIALGLLVDDPVVAGDAIKRELASGTPRLVSAWLGPTRLANAIMYATITNVVAYLPFLTLPGSTGRFLYALPVVITCSLVASRVVSMTFIPLLGYYLLRPKKEKPVEERRQMGFASLYYRVGRAAIRHRWVTLMASFGLLAVGAVTMSRLKSQFFPKDLAYLFYIDVWLPEDSSFEATYGAASRVETVVRDVAATWGREHPGEGGQPRKVLESLTTFVGGGGPRFWYSVSPEMQQLNYAQIIVQVEDKHDTSHLVERLQSEVAARVAGVRADVRQLESGAAVGLPVAIRVSGDDIPTLRALAGKLQGLFRNMPEVDRVRDDWGSEGLSVQVDINPDRANLAGVTNLDVARASVAAMNGSPVTSLRDGDKQIPVVARLRQSQRVTLEDMKNLYVYSGTGVQRVPLRQVAEVGCGNQTGTIRRRNQFRTVTVYCAPVQGVLPSEVMSAAGDRLKEFARSLPLGYHMEIGGEKDSQDEGFRNLAIVLLISLVAIFLALVFQFRNAVKPFLVFAAVPYGIVGSILALKIMSVPFGFMAFLGIISLVGVIVSHIIVLFDFIEEKHAEGEPFQEALLDAGIMRLRPVLITVGATVIALFPLALHGGPLWEPLCYAQIGGLLMATFVTLLLVPVLYAITVLDLKMIRWDEHPGHGSAGSEESAALPAGPVPETE